jgi:urease accessory protein
MTTYFPTVVPGLGARSVLRSAASMIAWASVGSSLEVNVSVAKGGCLDWQLKPMTATRGCFFSQRVSAKLGDGAALSWTEEIVLGRHGEKPGRFSLRLDVDIDENPLLRYQLELGPGVSGWDGPAVVGTNRAVGLVLLTTAGAVTSAQAVSSPRPDARRAGMALEDPGVLASSVGCRYGTVTARPRRGLSYCST